MKTNLFSVAAGIGRYIGLVGLALAGGASQGYAADPVAAGWDAFIVKEGTVIAGQEFVGVPIGNYNFGGTVANVSPGSVIFGRLNDTFEPTSSSFLQLYRLQLQSKNQFDFGGAGTDYYFITLQSMRTLSEGPRPASIGVETVNFGPQTFSSSVDVYYDVRKGSLTGPIIYSGLETVTSSLNSWARDPEQSDIPKINGVNYNLGGLGNSAYDMWLVGSPGAPVDSIPTITFQNAGGSVVLNLAVPEPSQVLLLLLGAGLVGFRMLRRKA